MRPIASLLICTALACAQPHEKRVVPLDRQPARLRAQMKVAVLVAWRIPEAAVWDTEVSARDVSDLAAELERQGYAVRNSPIPRPRAA